MKDRVTYFDPKQLLSFFSFIFFKQNDVYLLSIHCSELIWYEKISFPGSTHFFHSAETYESVSLSPQHGEEKKKQQH